MYINEANIIGNYPLLQASVQTPGYTEEQQQEAFLKLLMSADTRIDRTLVLNLNMQLSCDTMRSSLDADWQYLSAEHKEQLNGMTLKPR